MKIVVNPMKIYLTSRSLNYVAKFLESSSGGQASNLFVTENQNLLECIMRQQPLDNLEKTSSG